MEHTISLETKYQNLATEYSKLRANATVLKKAVLDEQSRSRELKESLKEHEQRLRKSNQEMESLTFRNQQLTKRISVLQDELNAKNNTKRVRGKSVENNPSTPSNASLLDEMQKKIMDNAQLISAMADKDFEITKLRESISELEDKITQKEKRISEMEHTHKLELKELKNNHVRQLKECEARHSLTVHENEIKQNGDVHSDKASVISSDDGQNQIISKQLVQLEQEKERWKTEYGLLLALQAEDPPIGEDKVNKIVDKDYKLKEYFYKRINELVGDKQEVQSIADSLAAECNALQVRLELSLEEKTESEQRLFESLDSINRLQEELNTTNHNYEQQLSTMSVHLADLNDKYTEQCELIQQLQYQLGIKGKKK